MKKDNIELTDPLREDVSNKLMIEIPFEILMNSELSLNEKLLLGLDFSLKNKRGFNQITNKDVGGLFNLHPNIVGDCRKSLLEEGYLMKEGRKYFLTDHYKTVHKSADSHENIKNKDQRNIKLPFEIYSNKALKTGEKLLWGEYNSISKGEKEYFAKREHTANRLSVSVESVSNWTKSLNEKGLFKKYQIVTGYHKHQRKIITCRFDEK
ncbi:hypothetical protein IVN40_04370 [Chryseobacterium indologenes]|uniref:hypothetical protein n=1 Tax=Chryseobacterium indologenes TaxID=253 RepID=UPI0018942ADA|nr:hypothetical protein [Chryseobacterium indologenes]MBF6643419.1 hypothetical protein [Chryseobacterium indologenes]